MGRAAGGKGDALKGTHSILKAIWGGVLCKNEPEGTRGMNSKFHFSLVEEYKGKEGKCSTGLRGQ